MLPEPNSTDAESASDPIAAALVTEVCSDLVAPPPDVAEIYRYLGYPGGAVPARHIAQTVQHILSEGQSCLAPKGAYSLYAVTSRTPQLLKLGDTKIAGNIGEFLAYSDRVAVFVVTVGETISNFATDAGKSGDVFAACIIDALGSWAAEAAADALMERVRHHLHDEEALTLRYSPGYCGMDIAQQRALFRMVPAASVGVKLLPSLLMHPLKSISGIVGLVPKEAVTSYRSACDQCLQDGCHMRR